MQLSVLAIIICNNLGWHERKTKTSKCVQHLTSKGNDFFYLFIYLNCIECTVDIVDGNYGSHLSLCL